MFAASPSDQTRWNSPTCLWWFGEWTLWKILTCSSHKLDSTKFWLSQSRQFATQEIQKAPCLLSSQLIHSASTSSSWIHTLAPTLDTPNSGVTTSSKHSRWSIWEIPQSQPNRSMRTSLHSICTKTPSSWSNQRRSLSQLTAKMFHTTNITTEQTKTNLCWSIQTMRQTKPKSKWKFTSKSVRTFATMEVQPSIISTKMTSTRDKQTSSRRSSRSSLTLIATAVARLCRSRMLTFRGY